MTGWLVTGDAALPTHWDDPTGALRAMPGQHVDNYAREVIQHVDRSGRDTRAVHNDRWALVRAGRPADVDAAAALAAALMAAPYSGGDRCTCRTPDRRDVRCPLDAHRTTGRAAPYADDDTVTAITAAVLGALADGSPMSAAARAALTATRATDPRIMTALELHTRVTYDQAGDRYLCGECGKPEPCPTRSALLPETRR